VLRGAFAVLAMLLGAGAAAFAQAPLEKVRVERYDIEVSFQPEKGFLHARAAVGLRASQYLEAIEFELNPYLKILEVTDPQDRKLDFVRSGRLGSAKLLVRLAEPCGAEQGLTLTLVYEGALPAKPLDYISKDGILLRDESRWYPAVDLSAFTQNFIAVGVPSSWTAITSGQMTSSIGGGLGATYTSRTTQPVSSRSLIAFPEFSPPMRCAPEPVQKEGYSVIESLSACYMGKQAKEGTRLAEAAHELLRLYSTSLGPLGSGGMLRIVEGFPGQHGAIGYSAPGFLVVSEDVVKFFGYPGYAPEFLPHEIAHQWFPIEVTITRQEDGWLAESLAEYLAWRYLAEKDPEAARRMVARAMRDALAPEHLPPLALGLKLFALENGEVTHATLYDRGMLVWRTLETVIDRERVDRALQEYYKRYAGRSASIADFRRICEEISGRDLGWFFDYFLRDTEIPEIELRRTATSAPNEYAGEIVLRNVPPEFQVRVEMRLETTAGPVLHSVATRGEVTPFTVATQGGVTRVTLDPDRRILRWTETARRYRSQRALLARANDLVQAGQAGQAAQPYEQALALDPENFSANEQLIRFALGRMYDRQKLTARAGQEFSRALELASLDAMETDFYRAWSRVYRARIARRRGRPAAARAEAEAGLALKSPALETQVLDDGADRVTTAAAELRALAKSVRH
jgi:tetratricopeptide (TPR) repeat protein